MSQFGKSETKPKASFFVENWTKVILQTAHPYKGDHHMEINNRNATIAGMTVYTMLHIWVQLTALAASPSVYLCRQSIRPLYDTSTTHH